MEPSPLSARFQSLPLLHTIKLGPSGADSLVGGLVHALWVSLTTSPVRLGVSPAAASTPTGVLNQRFEALFPHAGTLSFAVCLAPQLFLLVYPHTNMGPPYPLVATLPGLPAATCSPWSSSCCVATSSLCLAAHLCPFYRPG